MDIFCDVELAEYVAKQCGIDRAGIIAMALLDPDIDTPTKTNLADPVWWAARMADSPPAIIIKETRGEYPGGTPTTEEGFGRDAEMVTGADHEASIDAKGLKENRDFWEGANRRKWKVALVTNGDLLYYVDRPCSIDARINNPRDPKAAAFWKVGVKWQDFSNPVVVDMPEDIFD